MKFTLTPKKLPLSLRASTQRDSLPQRWPSSVELVLEALPIFLIVQARLKYHILRFPVSWFRQVCVDYRDGLKSLLTIYIYNIQSKAMPVNLSWELSDLIKSQSFACLEDSSKTSFKFICVFQTTFLTISQFLRGIRY